MRAGVLVGVELTVAVSGVEPLEDLLAGAVVGKRVQRGQQRIEVCEPAGAFDLVRQRGLLVWPHPPVSDRRGEGVQRAVPVVAGGQHVVVGDVRDPGQAGEHALEACVGGDGRQFFGPPLVLGDGEPPPRQGFRQAAYGFLAVLAANP